MKRPISFSLSRRRQGRGDTVTQREGERARGRAGDRARRGDGETVTVSPCRRLTVSPCHRVPVSPSRPLALSPSPRVAASLPRRDKLKLIGHCETQSVRHNLKLHGRHSSNIPIGFNWHCILSQECLYTNDLPLSECYFGILNMSTAVYSR